MLNPKKKKKNLTFFRLEMQDSGGHSLPTTSLNPRISSIQQKSIEFQEKIIIIFQLLATIVSDQIWSLRNKVRLYPATPIDPLSLSVSITRLSQEHFHAWSEVNSVCHQHHKHSILPQATFRIQYDVVVRHYFPMAATVCLDPNNNIVAAKT